MDVQDKKCVMVIDENLPFGLIANTAGIIEFPVPVLKAERNRIREIREKLYQPEFSGLVVVDFSDVAQRCKT